MQPLEVYKKFLLRINKNDTNKNINIPKGEFILLFNEQARSWLSTAIDKAESSDDIEDLADMYESDEEVTKLADKPMFSEFALPAKFFTKSSVYCVASKGDCKDVVVVAWDFKPKNKGFNIQNSNEEPSFEYQETKYSISGNKLLIYKKDFNVDKAYLSYYREPVQLDIVGYKKLDGTLSIDQSTDFYDKNIEAILDVCAATVLARYQNVEGYQLAQAKVVEANKK